MYRVRSVRQISKLVKVSCDKKITFQKKVKIATKEGKRKPLPNQLREQP